MMHNKNNDLFYAYLAGLIDGEGCFLVHKHANKKCKLGYSWQISLTITQANMSFLEELKKEIGYGQIVYSRAHFISFSSNRLRELLPKIRPHLRIKKNQCDLVLEALKYTKMRTRNRYMSYSNRKLEEINEKLVALHSH